MYTELSFVKKKLREIALRLFNRIENNDNPNFEQNGEYYFVSNFLKKFNGSKITVFDIGANIGQYSDIILNITTKLNKDTQLHLFEPTKSCFSVLSKKYETENITVNNFGLSNINVITSIFYDKEKSGLASIYKRNLDSYNIKLDKCENIQLRRIEEYIDEKNLKHIDLIKIDVEGHELKVLEGFGKYLNNNFIDYIQFEYGGANLDSHISLMELYDFITKKGFKIAKVLPNGLEIRKYYPYMDNFQYSNYVAISEKVLQS